MDSFESIIKTIFEGKGYWVKTSFKVNLTKDDKEKISRPTSPRWELDIVAYKGGEDEVLVIECKSYLDSTGVKSDGLKNGKGKERYKLFNDKKLRDVVLNRLLAQLVESGSCRKNATITLCLAAGRVAADNDRIDLTEHFNAQGWNFYSDKWIKESLVELSNSGYENDVAIVAVKILSR